MPCGCGAGAPGGVEQWVNVKADGTTGPTGTKAEALQSQSVNGGYIKQIS